MRGRKPKPTALKLLDGNPGKRALNRSEPQLEKGIPLVPPDQLDAVAREEWLTVVPQLNKAGVVTRVEVQALACYCQAVSRWQAAELLIARDGMIVMGEKGPMAHPAVKIAREHMVIIRSFASEFGLTPVSRSRVHVTEGRGAENEFKAI